MEWDGAPGYTEDAVGREPGLSRGSRWVLSQNVAGRSPCESGDVAPGCHPGMSRGVAGRSPELWRDRAPGCRGVKLPGVGGWSPGLPPAVPSPQVPAPPSSGRCRQQLHRVPAHPAFPTFPSAPAG